eukprot:NODE_7419_length_262_cov_11.248826_g6806_i0.p3 GENE.NODE_7419_length_262_cov_11.248826_g6806_i0~~NODE_7419_length_262_cov_11.248826_g6806_i0.p3  ORF type:complete len:53 (+),score=2.96 NODE_7419_length_262_cov_11.248826_g6806_i0:67-225(+)
MTKQLFPATAGMNRGKDRLLRGVIAVPRDRGDEPAESEAAAQSKLCSPRPRG